MINQIVQVRLPGGETASLVDWSSRPLYSTIDLLSGFTDQELRTFSYIKGEGVTQSSNFAAADSRSANLRDTNITSASEMAATEEFLVWSIEVEVFQFILTANVFTIAGAGLPVPNAGNMGQLHHRIVLGLEVSEKDFPQAGLGWFPTGFGPSIGASGGGAGAVRTFANNGLPSREAPYQLTNPVHIGGTEDYSVLVSNPDGTAVNFVDEAGSAAATTVMQLRIYLCGLHKRPLS